MQVQQQALRTFATLCLQSSSCRVSRSLLLFAAICSVCSYGRLEVHARLLLPVPQLASEAATAAAPALACQPLVVSMAHLLSPPACPPASAQDMLALWAGLPVQVSDR
jgi:hypothetical protein